jgi:hypothetical protein
MQAAAVMAMAVALARKDMARKDIADLPDLPPFQAITISREQRGLRVLHGVEGRKGDVARLGDRFSAGGGI